METVAMNEESDRTDRPLESVRLTLDGRVTRPALDSLIDDLCSRALVQGVRDLRGRIVHFDLSRARFVDLDVSLLLITVIGALREAGNLVQLTLPHAERADSNNVWSFLIRWKFFDALRNFGDLPENLLSDEQLQRVDDSPRYRQRRGLDESGRDSLLFTERLLAISALRLDNELPREDQVNAYLSRFRDQRILIRALTLACGLEHDDADSLLSYIATEGLRNSLDHAKGNYSMVAMQVLDQELAAIANQDPALILVIVDDGIGIPRVLREAKEEGLITGQDLPADDVSLIEMFASIEVARDSMIIAASTSQGIRSDRRRSGMGLFFLRDYVSKLGGRLTIRSGKGVVQFAEDQEPRRMDFRSESPGTVVKIEIPLTI
jgi:Histidine kinase-, DNA gyrase B-, and HSP90-like ATPase